MPPKLILIRHAEGAHNATKDYSLHDPDLTELGREQCLETRQSLLENPLAQQAGLIVVSPMRRTIQTALGCLDWLVDKGVRMVADADWQENTLHDCDVGTPAAKLAAEFPGVDFTGVDPVYPDKKSAAGARYHYTRAAVLRRAQHALARLYARPEAVVVVVSHSGFLRAGVSGSWFQNADYRIFDLVRAPSADAGAAVNGDGVGGGGGGAGGGEEEDPVRRGVDGYTYSVVQHESTKGTGGLGRSRPTPVELGEGLPLSQ